MNRRTFFYTSSGVLMGQMLSGCSLIQHRQPLTIQLLQSSLPPQVIKTFQNQSRTANEPVSLKISLSPTPDDLYELLEHWADPNHKASPFPFQLPWMRQSQPTQLSSLGQYWLSSAIAKQLIQPLPVENLKQWRSLPDAWQALVQRDENGEKSPKGKVWAAPYRWGGTVIAYRRDKFAKLGWTPKDWPDLWRPEIQGYLSLPDHPQEVIGLALKALGHPYDTPDLTAISALPEQLQRLNQQTRVYSSNAYIQPLLLGDTWVAVGSSSDFILAMQQEAGDIELVVPSSGTALWADLWVQPKLAKPAAALESWLDYCWQPETIQQIAHFSRGGSWLKTPPLNPLLGETALWIDPIVLERSQFLQPLSAALAAQYTTLWKTMRSAPIST